ncbi:MAG: 2-oxoacid:acceptor oxidoreductase subunit alpha [Planctomycetes bacterium]|nr:2-oxoacid:acceptor oxidoreductase subunit alpha [Planctomycetota bacterium]NOG52894.1 2-oxoacid:acceptor oxidoreductase subunit alpha [Planctomycetota bacterium]
MSNESESVPDHQSPAAGSSPQETLESVVIRFCGDSGDGMQLTGTQFTNTSAMFGNDIATFPDYPAEIRAPAGTLPGVSGFQVNFASNDIYTPGDTVQVLVAMNPAGLNANVADVDPGGIIIANADAFTSGNLKKAGYASNPLEDGTLSSYRVFPVPISRLCEESLADTGLGAKAIAQAKNMFTLGLVYWLYDRPMDSTIDYLNSYFGKKKNKPELAEMNVKALKAGYYLGETGELFVNRYHVPKAKLASGTYRKISGNEATALGLITASRLANSELVYCSYPITPASDILHTLCFYKHYHVKTLQLEDEIAAMCGAVGAAYAGGIAVTGTSGPGLALKSEALGLAVMAELPVVIVNVQRGGPSTGLPTKTEQADLLQAMWGRNGECPAIVLAARSPSDCFDLAIESIRLAVRYMSPVILLTDGYVANGAEPWQLPIVDQLEPIEINHASEFNYHNDELDGDGNNCYMPYLRDENESRPWAIPGTPKLEHRIGGLEKDALSGNVSYTPDNHEHMVRQRASKVNRVADSLPPTEIQGEQSGDLLIIGWGGTYGSIYSATNKLLQAGHKVGTVHLRYINPLPNDLGDIIKRFKRVAIPELNLGQLSIMIRSKYLVDAVGINKVKGKPFLVAELVEQLSALLPAPTAGSNGVKEPSAGSGKTKSQAAVAK